jgi:4-alpha-glucanotransferase
MFQRNLLRATSRAYGLQCSYKNVDGLTIWSPEKTLLKLLEDFSGQQIKNNEDLKKILDLKNKNQYLAALKPCHVLWGGVFNKINISSTDKLENSIVAEIILEDESSLSITLTLKSQRKTELGFKYIYSTNHQLPLGYHRLNISLNGIKRTTFLICPPEKIQAAEKKAWGPFVPLYALKSESDWGIGSFREASALAQGLRKFDGSWMGLLPMLAGNFDYSDCDPSPYSSLSRLFWNEIYLDVEALVKKYQHSIALDLISSIEFKEKILNLLAKTHVAYYEVYQLKKQVLLLLSDDFFSHELNNSDDYRQFEKENPDINSYAIFRSTDLRDQNFHRFAQFEMNNTLKNFSKENDFGLYMDYPVGVNDGGFDYKEFRSVFFGEVSVGAPPEPVFALGQDWGFPAFHPEGMQKDNYHYFRKSLQHHLKFCKILRLDHIMGLHRIYCVPKKFNGEEGVYLRFAPEELFAVVILEAHRAGADLIGENLGTVPAAVDTIIRERNLNGMWVLQCETWRSPAEAFSAIKKNSLVCVNTHDMPMLASFRKGADLELVESLKILSHDYKVKFQQERKKQIANWEQTFGADNFTANIIQKIAASDSKYFVVNLEDLWNEEMPQNIPGTWKEYPNWRKKFSLEIGEIMKNENVLKVLASLKEFRKR